MTIYNKNKLTSHLNILYQTRALDLNETIKNDSLLEAFDLIILFHVIEFLSELFPSSQHISLRQGLFTFIFSYHKAGQNDCLLLRS